MRKSVLVVLAAAAAFAITVASAASLTINSFLPQEGTVNAACDTDGVTVVINETTGEVTSATVSGLSDECIGATLSVNAAGNSVTYSGSIAVSDGVEDVNETTVSLTPTGTAGPKFELTSYTVTIG